MTEGIWDEVIALVHNKELLTTESFQNAMLSRIEKLKADWEQRELVLQGCEEQGYISINRGAIVVRCGFKEKAEKWDKLKPDYLELNNKWIGCEIKLEAVTTYLKEHGLWTLNLKKILEDEGDGY